MLSYGNNCCFGTSFGTHPAFSNIPSAFMSWNFRYETFTASKGERRGPSRCRIDLYQSALRTDLAWKRRAEDEWASVAKLAGIVGPRAFRTSAFTAAAGS